MSRARSPDRERALKIWLDSGRQKKPKEIALEIGIGDDIVRKWKCLDKWNELPEPKPKRRGAPEGNKNAIGNTGGSGGPENNDKAVKHGFFRRIFPDDAETLAIIDEIETKTPLDILWENIVIQYTAIARAQKIMFVRDQDDITRELKREKSSDTAHEIEYNIQFAWDKQASFVKAQSAAMLALNTLMRRYDDMINRGLGDEEQRMRIEKLKAEVKAIETGKIIPGKVTPEEAEALINAWVGAI